MASCIAGMCDCGGTPRARSVRQAASSAQESRTAGYPTPGAPATTDSSAVQPQSCKTSSDSVEIQESKPSDRECGETSGMDLYEGTWVRVGDGAAVVEGSSNMKVEKLTNSPDYSNAVASPGISCGKKTWQLRQRGDGRCEVGVSKANVRLDTYQRSVTWNVHFTGSGGFKSPYLNGKQDRFPGGPSGVCREKGLLYRIELDMDEGVMAISFPELECDTLIVPRPDYLSADMEMFPYINMDHIGTSFEILSEVNRVYELQWEDDHIIATTLSGEEAFRIAGLERCSDFQMLLGRLSEALRKEKSRLSILRDGCVVEDSNAVDDLQGILLNSF